MSSGSPAPLQRIDAGTLRGWPLPALDGEADKEARGRVLVIAGSREVPGAAVLAATAALRVGAGKLAIATAASVAVPVALAMPEARVISLPETPGGGLDPAAAALLQDDARSACAVLVGPGMMDGAATRDFVAALVPWLRGRAVVVDALAMDVVGRLERFDEPVLLTPHAGEMAHLTGADKAAITDAPAEIALAAARRWNALVALKGPQTVVAAPDGRGWLHDGGTAGLATSGSGDTLAGAIAGLAARGAPLEQACAWGVVLHACAGARLAERLGPVGFLARELPLEMLAVLRGLEAAAPGTTGARDLAA